MLARPERFFEDRFGLTSSALERLLGSHLAGRVDHADLYLEYRISEELTLEEGAVKKASRHVSQGRAFAPSRASARATPTPTISLCRIWKKRPGRPEPSPIRRRASAVVAVGSGRPHDLYTLAEPPVTAALDGKLALLGQVDAAARAMDPRVKQVIASLGSEDVIILIATPSGWTIGDKRPLTRLNVTVIVEENGKREIGSLRRGRARAARLLPRRRALAALHLRGGATGHGEAPRRGSAGGEMTVVLGPAGRASCFTRRWATVSKATSTASRPRRSPGAWARRSPPSWSR